MSDGSAGQARSIRSAVTVEQRRRHVHVWTPDGERVVVDPDDHREDVVRRLLDRGVSPTTLRALLPDWDAMISRLVAEDRREEPDEPDEPAG